MRAEGATRVPVFAARDGAELLVASRGDIDRLATSTAVE
jgi:hypothetical protein